MTAHSSSPLPKALRQGVEALIAKYRDFQGQAVCDLVDDLVKLLEAAS